MSTQILQIDECRRLWVLDTGRIADHQYCAPQLLVFNLDTDKLIHRYRFPQEAYKTDVSLFITPVRRIFISFKSCSRYNELISLSRTTALIKSVLFSISQVLDVKDPPPTGQCFNTRAYIADVTGFGLVVYDSQSNTSWRVQNKLFYPNPYFGTHNIAGEQFDLMDGLFGLALSPRQPQGNV